MERPGGGWSVARESGEVSIIRSLGSPRVRQRRPSPQRSPYFGEREGQRHRSVNAALVRTRSPHPAEQPGAAQPPSPRPRKGRGDVETISSRRAKKNPGAGRGPLGFRDGGVCSGYFSALPNSSLLSNPTSLLVAS